MSDTVARPQALVIGHKDFAIGIVSAASIVDYTIALWRGRARSSAA